MPADGFFVDILLMFIAFLCCMLNACKFALKMPIWDSLPLYSSILVLIGAGYGKFLIPCVVTRPGHEIWLLCLMPVLFSTLRLPLAYANYRRCSFALIFRRSCTYSNHFYTDTPRLSEGGQTKQSQKLSSVEAKHPSPGTVVRLWNYVAKNDICMHARHVWRDFVIGYVFWWWPCALLSWKEGKGSFLVATNTYQHFTSVSCSLGWQ